MYASAGVLFGLPQINARYFTCDRSKLSREYPLLSGNSSAFDKSAKQGKIVHFYDSFHLYNRSLKLTEKEKPEKILQKKQLQEMWKEALDSCDNKTEIDSLNSIVYYLRKAKRKDKNFMISYSVSPREGPQGGGLPESCTII